MQFPSSVHCQSVHLFVFKKKKRLHQHTKIINKKSAGKSESMNQLLNHRVQYVVEMINDTFVNCNWVDTRWQYYSTHLHTNNNIEQHK